MAKRYAVILAAGEGTRMKSNIPKILHPVLGRSMVQHVIDQLQAINLTEMIAVVGHNADQVMEHIGESCKFAVQKEQLGTGHAVIQAEDLLKDKRGTTIVVCGDTPLITKETYENLFEYHEKTGAKATVLTAIAPDATGYGRVIRNEQHEVERIVEHKDANERELQVNEINTGTYCFDNEALFTALQGISNDNAQGEYYLPDVIEILRRQSEKIAAYTTPDYDETLGINDRIALAQAEKILKRRINERHMKNGVTIIDPEHTYIHPDVVIEQDVAIHPGSMITGASIIQTNAEIGPHSEIHNSIIGEAAIIQQSVVKDSQIGAAVSVGPYAHIRPETKVEDEVRIGNFVEIKKSTIGKESKVSHLSYIGDANIGNHVNIGCGTITVNYDGKNKHLTTIEDDAFIGCNSNLVAPVTIEKGSYVAAGSTITKNVPKDSLSIARARQANKEGYATKMRNRLKD
ncbi:MAG TPA: bifunctional UDP-N-acetylglucosamine diphosphorylase/glucosamine-1-phosphate N-acetyltransferase GlmU [Bacillota bacterium]